MPDVVGIIEGPGVFSFGYLEQTRRVVFLVESTPYQGGYFHLKYEFTEEFPASLPICPCPASNLHWQASFASKVFHPNVSGVGEICVNTLKKLKAVVWHWAHLRYYQVPAYLS